MSALSRRPEITRAVKINTCIHVGWTKLNGANVVCVVVLKHDFGRGRGGVLVKVSDLGSKGHGFDPRAVPKSECMFVNIYHY